MNKFIDKTNEQKPTTDWLKTEAESLNVHSDYDELPSLKFAEGKITRFKVDFSKPFDKWTGEQGNKTVTKKIIPVTEKDEKKNLWLNVRNPLYSEIVKRGQKGQVDFAVLQSGSQANTKYTVVEEE